MAEVVVDGATISFPLPTGVLTLAPNFKVLSVLSSARSQANTNPVALASDIIAITFTVTYTSTGFTVPGAGILTVTSATGLSLRSKKDSLAAVLKSSSGAFSITPGPGPNNGAVPTPLFDLTVYVGTWSVQNSGQSPVRYTSL